MVADLLNQVSLRDLIGISVVIIAAINWLRNREPYSVCWSQLLDWPLFERDGWLTPDLKISFNNSNLEYPRVVLIKIENRGKHPVRESDYEKPIKITLSEQSKIIYAHALSKTIETSNLCSFDENMITLDKCLLNPGEWLVIRSLIDSPKHVDIRLTGRLAGIVRLNEKGIKIRDRIDYTVLAFLTIGVFFFVNLSFPKVLGQDSTVLAAFLGAIFSTIYEWLRRLRYIMPNARVAELLAGLIKPFWFTSRSG